MNKTIRCSNIELLRILAMILIIASHATNYILQGNVWKFGGKKRTFIFLKLLEFRANWGVCYL